MMVVPIIERKKKEDREKDGHEEAEVISDQPITVHSLQYEGKHEIVEHISTPSDFSQCSLTSEHMQNTVKQLTYMSRFWLKCDIWQPIYTNNLYFLN